MSEWKSVFNTWREFSPFLRRTLMTKEQYWKWAGDLGYQHISKENENIDILMDYLEEKNLLHPVYVAKRGSEFGLAHERARGLFRAQRPSQEEMNKVLKYYHPFQFFQFIMYWKCYRNKYSKDSGFFFYLQKKLARRYESNEKIVKKQISRIEKAEFKWIKEKNKRGWLPNSKNCKKFPETVRYTRQQIENIKKRLKSRQKPNKKQQKKKGKRECKSLNKRKEVKYDNFLTGLKHSHWLTSDYLKAWIKVDSLFLFGEYIATPSSIYIQPILNVRSRYNKEERDEASEKYNEWRDGIMKDKKSFLSDDKGEILKKFYNTLEWNFFRSFRYRLEGLDNWKDLIDIIPISKFSKFKGNLYLSVNILNISRFLERMAWELLELNLIPWPRNKEKEKPYCFFDGENGEKEVVEFRASVLSDFSLFASSPYILYVEGATEYNIIKFYFNLKGTWLPIVVENSGGINKLIQRLTINKPIKERVYYYFLDYEKASDYKKNEKIVNDRGAFFFPDFVTENFKPEDVLGLFKRWFSDIGGILTKDEEMSLSEKLNECKAESDRLIEMENKEGNPAGFEKVLLGFIKKKHPSLFMKAYPEVKVNNEGRSYLSKNESRRTFKKVFTENYLVSIVENALRTDPERKGEKLAFEDKLKPFYDSINQYRLRNDIYKYDLKL